jgi:NADH-quinone oxidoreductase subunit E
VPLSSVYGVVTFYAQFHLTPRGRHTIRACQGTACHVKGARRVLDVIERRLGIQPGETTLDLRFTLETVACLGACFLAPTMMVDDQYFGKLTPRDVESVLEQFA